MHVIVTGGSGFLGSHIVEELLQRGHTVDVLDLAPLPDELHARSGCRHVGGDLTRLASIEAVLAGADAVCHLAGVGDVYLAAREPHTAAMLNVGGTANVAEAALRQGVRKVVYASTWEVYGRPQYQPIDEAHPCNPDHPYNITKYAGERLLVAYDRLKGLPVIALRLGTAFGPRMRPNSVFSLFIDKARNGEPIVIQGTGEQIRQFTHARDIARAFALAAESPVHGQVLNTVASQPVSIKQLAEMVRAMLPTRLEYAPARAGDIFPAIVDSSRARRLLGWEPQVLFDHGLAELALAHAGAVRRNGAAVAPA
jgi:UDP-glucose 4-epimerase